MGQSRVMRGILYAVICVVAGMTGLFVKKVLIEGGAFSLSSLEIMEVTVTSVLVGVIVPAIEAKKNSR